MFSFSFLKIGSLCIPLSSLIKSLLGICYPRALCDGKHLRPLWGSLWAAGRPAQRGHGLGRRVDIAGCRSLPALSGDLGARWRMELPRDWALHF